MTQWYYSNDGRDRLGPVGDADLAGLHAEGGITPDTLVWREGLSQWQSWRTVMHEVMASRPAEPAAAAGVVAAAGGTGLGVADTADPGSPYAPPRAPVEQVRDVHANGHVVYAGFWKRVAAYVIDAVIVGVLGVMLGAAVGGLMGAAFGVSGGFDGSLRGGPALAIQLVAQGLSLVLGACYYGWFYASTQQATPGKLAIGIKVVRSDGRGCGFWRGFWRYFATLLSGLLLCIGYLMVAFTGRKQALHDLICDTVVVDQWAFTAHPDQQRGELGVVAWVVLGVCALLLAGVVVMLGAMLAAIGGGYAGVHN